MTSAGWAEHLQGAGEYVDPGGLVSRAGQYAEGLAVAAHGERPAGGGAAHRD